MGRKKKEPETKRKILKNTAHDWRPRFIAALAQSGVIGTACTAANVNRSVFYRARDDEPDFAVACADAMEQAADALEQEARRRACDGVDKPVIYKGQMMGTWIDLNGNIVSEGTPGARLIPLTYKEYSDTLLMFKLKGDRPHKFRDNASVELTGKDGGPVKTDNEHRLTADQLAKLSLEERIRLCSLPVLPKTAD